MNLIAATRAEGGLVYSRKRVFLLLDFFYSPRNLPGSISPGLIGLSISIYNINIDNINFQFLCFLLRLITPAHPNITLLPKTTKTILHRNFLHILVSSCLLNYSKLKMTKWMWKCFCSGTLLGKLVPMKKPIYHPLVQHHLSSHQ